MNKLGKLKSRCYRLRAELDRAITAYENERRKVKQNPTINDTLDESSFSFDMWGRVWRDKFKCKR